MPLHRFASHAAHLVSACHRGTVPATVFIDENLARGFLLVGVVVGTSEVGKARATMRAQLPRGARRVHFVKENDARRRHILDAIAELRLPCVLIEASDVRRIVDARSSAVEALVRWAVEADVTRLVFERDDNSVALDQRVIAPALATAGIAIPRSAHDAVGTVALRLRRGGPGVDGGAFCSRRGGVAAGRGRGGERRGVAHRPPRPPER